ncbi:PQQ-binding-like beta-propeller repeat protein, partial [Streptacidiphilus monticola]
AGGGPAPAYPGHGPYPSTTGPAGGRGQGSRPDAGGGHPGTDGPAAGRSAEPGPTGRAPGSPGADPATGGQLTPGQPAAGAGAGAYSGAVGGRVDPALPGHGPYRGTTGPAAGEDSGVGAVAGTQAYHGGSGPAEGGGARETASGQVRLAGAATPIGPGVRVVAPAVEEPVAPAATGWVRRGARSAPVDPVVTGASTGSAAPPAAESGWRPWRFRMQHDVWGAPVVAEGALFLASFEVHAFDIATGRRRFKSRDVAWAMVYADGRVHAADGQNLFTLHGGDGSERWRAVLPGWTYSLDAAGGVLVAGTRGGGVHVRSAIDGSELWSAADAQQRYENPACGPSVLGDAVYYYGEGRLHSLELTSGQRQWSHPVGEDVPSRPLLHARTLYVANGAGVVALDETSGQERWRFDAPAVLFTSPVTAGQLVYVADYLGAVFALDAVTGAVVWTAQTGRRQGADKVVVTDGIALVGAGDTLYAFDAALGEERWRYSARGELAGAPAADGGLVHVGSRDRSLHTLDLTTGRLRWKLDTGGEIAGSPVAAEGRVFACSKDHCVYALDALLGTATAGNG